MSRTGMFDRREKDEEGGTGGGGGGDKREERLEKNVDRRRGER